MAGNGKTSLGYEIPRQKRCKQPRGLRENCCFHHVGFYIERHGTHVNVPLASQKEQAYKCCWCGNLDRSMALTDWEFVETNLELDGTV